MPSLAVRHFVEETGLFLELAGMPRMAGRILGHLLICDPPEQTAEDISRSIEASRASISTMTRLLLNANLIERASLPGRRRDVYRVHADGFRRQIAERMRLVTRFREVLERGMQALEGEPPARKERLVAMYEFYRWLERELPRLFERYEKSSSKKGP